MTTNAHDTSNEDLRDRFAMAALTGLLAASDSRGNSDITDDAYNLADLMMESRKPRARDPEPAEDGVDPFGTN